MLLANFDRKEHLQHRAVSLRQHGFLVHHYYHCHQHHHCSAAAAAGWPPLIQKAALVRCSVGLLYNSADCNTTLLLLYSAVLFTRSTVDSSSRIVVADGYSFHANKRNTVQRWAFVTQWETHWSLLSSSSCLYRSTVLQNFERTVFEADHYIRRATESLISHEYDQAIYQF